MSPAGHRLKQLLILVVGGSEYRTCVDKYETAESKQTTAVVSEKAIIPVLVPPSGQLPIVDHHCLCRRHCHESRFAPYPLPSLQRLLGLATVPADMFKHAFPSSDTMATNQAAAATAAGSIPAPPPPANVPFALQFSHQQPPSYSTFTPEYQHFPYTFSSITPPAYSWANTNSTHVMKCVTITTTHFVVVMIRRHITADFIFHYIIISGSQDQVIHSLWTHPHTISTILGLYRNAKSIWTPSKCFMKFYKELNSLPLS